MNLVIVLRIHVVIACVAGIGKGRDDKLHFLFYYEREKILGNYFSLIHLKNMTGGLKNL